MATPGRFAPAILERIDCRRDLQGPGFSRTVKDRVEGRPYQLGTVIKPPQRLPIRFDCMPE